MHFFGMPSHSWLSHSQYCSQLSPTTFKVRQVFCALQYAPLTQPVPGQLPSSITRVEQVVFCTLQKP